MFEVDREINVSCQIFKSRFGISGRDFLLALGRARMDNNEYEQLVIGARSAPEGIDYSQFCDRPEIYDLYAKSTAKTTRGFVHNAGFLIQRRKADGLWRIVYINDINPVTCGIPHWIVSRVALDQLNIVKNIPPLLVNMYKENNGKITLEPYRGAKNRI